MDSRVYFCWVVALKSEALPLCDKFKMTLVDHEAPYPIFKDLDGYHWLVISGVGKVQAAAASMYLHQISKANRWTAWINIGIAGQKESKFGKLYLIDKITEMSTGKVWCPGTVISTITARGSLMTVDKPEIDFKKGDLFDMESAGFFDVVRRLSCNELVLVLKIVSDGPFNDIKKISPEIIKTLMFNNIDEIESIIFKMEHLVRQEYQRISLPNEYVKVIRKWHFSRFRKHEIKSLIHRWNIKFPEDNLLSFLNECKSARSVIYKISSHLDSCEIDWGQR